MKSKKIFWILTIIFGTIIIGVTALMTTMVIMEDNYYPWEIALLGVPALIFFGILILIGRFVYYDAKRRGMDPWLWMTIALFIPNLIGLIIYLVFRNQYSIESKKCRSCQRSIKEDYNICPYCGTDLSAKCHNCGATVEDDWLVCPKCAKPLK